MPEPVTFHLITEHPPGTIERLLVESYAGLPLGERRLADYRRRWRAADRQAFANPDSIGACSFITCLGGQAIGTASFDPRQTPERGVIGQNGIVPAFRGRGCGRRQIEEVCRRLRELRILQAVVTTGDEPFFEPARRMYLACGFRQTARHPAGRLCPFGLVEFEMQL